MARHIAPWNRPRLEEERFQSAEEPGVQREGLARELFGEIRDREVEIRGRLAALTAEVPLQGSCAVLALGRHGRRSSRSGDCATPRCAGPTEIRQLR